MAIPVKTQFPIGSGTGGAPFNRFVQFNQPVGNIIYVHSSGTSTGPGFTPATAYSTIDAAVGACTANNGDYIVCLPGHAETLTAAGQCVLDVAGITVVGVGAGSLQPTVTLGSATGTDIDIDAANVTIEGLRIVAGFADVAAAIDVNADDFTLRRCRCVGDNAGLNAKIWVQDAAATASDRITVEDCYFEDRDAANTHIVNFAGTGNGHRILRNVIMCDCGTAAIGGAGVVTNCLVLDNLIDNAATDNDACINFAATATGIVARNLCGGGAAQANGITATAMAINQNYYAVSSEDLSGILEPIAT